MVYDGGGDLLMFQTFLTSTTSLSHSSLCVVERLRLRVAETQRERAVRGDEEQL